jgi:hypothetical protein
MKNISEETYLEMKKLVEEYEQDKPVDSFDKPYIEVITVKRKLKYNPKFGNDKICECGHPYHRHFDSYDRMSNIGCKYCECYNFVEKK